MPYDLDGTKDNIKMMTMMRKSRECQLSERLRLDNDVWITLVTFFNNTILTFLFQIKKNIDQEKSPANARVLQFVSYYLLPNPRVL